VIDQAQELRYLLDGALDPTILPMDRRNAIHMLIQRLQGLEQELAGREVTPNETT
jgi:hypothetical protein